jgi:hypothetical protein
MFRPRDIRARARLIAEQVLAASDVALGGDGHVAVAESMTEARHPHHRLATLPGRERRPGRVSPMPVPCRNPVGHRLERHQAVAASRGD